MMATAVADPVLTGGSSSAPLGDMDITKFVASMRAMTSHILQGKINCSQDAFHLISAANEFNAALANVRKLTQVLPVLPPKPRPSMQHLTESLKGIFLKEDDALHKSDFLTLQIIESYIDVAQGGTYVLTLSDGRYKLRARADPVSGRGVLATLKDTRIAQMTIHVSRKATPGVDVAYEVQDYVDLSHMYGGYWNIVGVDPPLLTTSVHMTRAEVVQLADVANNLNDGLDGESSDTSADDEAILASLETDYETDDPDVLQQGGSGDDSDSNHYGFSGHIVCNGGCNTTMVQVVDSEGMWDGARRGMDGDLYGGALQVGRTVLLAPGQCILDKYPLKDINELGPSNPWATTPYDQMSLAHKRQNQYHYYGRGYGHEYKYDRGMFADCSLWYSTSIP